MGNVSIIGKLEIYWDTCDKWWSKSQSSDREKALPKTTLNISHRGTKTVWLFKARASIYKQLNTPLHDAALLTRGILPAYHANALTTIDRMEIHTKQQGHIVYTQSTTVSSTDENGVMLSHRILQFLNLLLCVFVWRIIFQNTPLPLHELKCVWNPIFFSFYFYKELAVKDLSYFQQLSFHCFLSSANKHNIQYCWVPGFHYPVQSIQSGDFL